MSKKKTYLGDYWYDLKYQTKGLHGVYRLFYKMIVVLGTPGIASRCKYHYLVDGPWPIATNLKIYDYLFENNRPSNTNSGSFGKNEFTM